MPYINIQITREGVTAEQKAELIARATAMMVEVLCTVLAGGIPTMVDGNVGSKHHFAAYNIEAFTDLEQFKDTMDDMMVDVLGKDPATTFVIIDEVETDNWGVAGQTVTALRKSKRG